MRATSNGNILYDSVISLSLVTESTDKKRMIYMMRSESLDQKIILKKCNPLSDICLIKESLFIIVHLRESISDGSTITNEVDAKSREIGYNHHFLLQHMISKKFMAKDKQGSNNNYRLKLVEKESEAMPFSFKKIVDTKSSQSSIQFNQIIYLSAYIKDKSQYFYVNKSSSRNQRVHDPYAIGPNKGAYDQEKQDQSEIVLEKDFLNKFVIINQEHFYMQDNFIYSGDLLNLVFDSEEKNDRSFMIGVQCQKSSNIGELINIKEEEREELDNYTAEVGLFGESTYISKINRINNNYELEMKNDPKNKIVKAFNLSKEYFKHINNFSFWVLEEDGFSNGMRVNRAPIAAESYVRIKNPILGLYLRIKPIIDESKTSPERYEFELVDEEELKDDVFYNFQIFHYAINVETKNLTSNGRYIIKYLFKPSGPSDKKEKVDLRYVKNSFSPIVLRVGTEEVKLIVEKGDDFIFEIKKIPLNSGNEAIYLKSIIDQLETFVKNSKLKCLNQTFMIDLVKRNLTFLTNYLMNLEVSFRDHNLDINQPVPHRQNLLRKYNILDIINKIISVFLDFPTIPGKVEKKSDGKQIGKTEQSSIQEQLAQVMKQLLSFLIYISTGNEKIKKEIFLNIADILSLGERLFNKDRTILLTFIFKIIKQSTALQEAILGSRSMLQSWRKSQKFQYEKTILLEKIFEYIKSTQNYLYFYTKILNFDQVSYKKNEIRQKIKEHIDANDEHYFQMLEKKKEKVKKYLAGVGVDKITPDTRKRIYLLLHLLPQFDFSGFLDLKECCMCLLFKMEDVSLSPKKFHESRKYGKSIDIKRNHECGESDKDASRADSRKDGRNKFGMIITPSMEKEDNVDLKAITLEEKEDEEDENNTERNTHKKANTNPLAKSSGQTDKHVLNIDYDKLSLMDYFDTKLTYIMADDITTDVIASVFGIDVASGIAPALPTKILNEVIPREPEHIQKEIMENFSKTVSVKIEKNFTMIAMDSTKCMQNFGKNIGELFTCYQFCVNQFFRGIHSLYKMLKNICINYLSSEEIPIILINIKSVKNELLSKINEITYANYKDPLLEIYNRCMEKPSILTINFDIEKNSENGVNSNEEFYNYKFLFKFCKIYDRITFLIEKIGHYIEIRQLLHKPKDLEAVLDSIVTTLNIKRNELLEHYKDLKDLNETVSDSTVCFNNFKFYVAKSKFKFITKMLAKYDIVKYFDRIIYIQNVELLEQMKSSTYEFKSMKYEIEKIYGELHKKKDSQDSPTNSTQSSIENIIHNLNKISIQFKTIYDSRRKQGKTGSFRPEPSGKKSNSLDKDNTINSREGLMQMFLNEDQTYFKKIEFPKTLTRMIEVCKKFTGVDNKVLLNYCLALLRSFESMTKNYDNFHKIVEQEYDKYMDLIKTSLESVNNYIKTDLGNEGIKSHSIYQSIIYYSYVSFLYLIQNCKKKKFGDLKKTMSEIMQSFINLYDNIPNRLEYHIFYTYIVTRVLLFLNRDKAYDFYNYEDFFKTIFPYEKMKIRINNCIQEISKESIPGTCGTPTPSQERSNYSCREDSAMGNFFKSSEIENLLYLNFLTIYTIYLNELNSVRQTSSSSDANMKSQKIDCKILSDKARVYLDNTIDFSEVGDIRFDLAESPDAKTPTKSAAINLISSPRHSTQMIRIPDNNIKNDATNFITKVKYFTSECQAGNNAQYRYINDFEFEFVMLQSIIYYKYEKKVLEIGILIDNRYKFFYYDTDFIDILLLEKILREMKFDSKLKEKIKNEKIFDDGENINNNKNKIKKNEMVVIKHSEISEDEDGLCKILEKRNEFNAIISRASQENVYYEILLDQYIKSNMIKYLDQIIKKFNQNDMKKIEIMKFFNYVKMNEMYTEGKEISAETEGDSSANSAEAGISLRDKLIITERLKWKDWHSGYNVKMEMIFANIRYLSATYSDFLTKLNFKTSFSFLYANCRQLKEKVKSQTTEERQKVDYEQIIESLINLFNIQANRKLALDGDLFFIILKAISSMLNLLKKEKLGIVTKNADLMKTFFYYMDFIFEHLNVILENTVLFMQNPQSQKKYKKFNKKVEKLKKIMKFITTVIKFNSIKGLNILTEKMKNFNSKILKQIITLIFLLLEFNNSKSNPTITLLIDFINNFIHGPDVENLKLLFSQGYFGLLKYIIKKVDYYQLFLANINNSNIYENIDTIIEIEYKIMQIFFVFFNIVHNDKSDMSMYIKVRNFFEEENEHIKKKLKRIYYILKIEMDHQKEKEIEAMLVNLNDNDFYSEGDLEVRVGISEKNNEQDAYSSRDRGRTTLDVRDRGKTAGIEPRSRERFKTTAAAPRERARTMAIDSGRQSDEGKSMEKSIEKEKQKVLSYKKKSSKYLIKFELILTYYTLFIFNKEVIFENYFSITTYHKTFWSKIWNFVRALFIFLFNMVLLPYYLTILFLSICFKETQTKKLKSLFDNLYDINEKYQKVDENEMMQFMKRNITSVEVVINEIVYKIYFPILSKSQKIKENRFDYINVESSELQNYIYHIMNKYDEINVMVTENHNVNKLLEVPILRFFFLNRELFKAISLIVALVSNFLILASYSDFNIDIPCKYGEERRLKCPYLFYNGTEENLDYTKRLFDILGYIQIIMTSFLFIDFYIRQFMIQLTKLRCENQLEQAKIAANKDDDRGKSGRNVESLGCCTRFWKLYMMTLLNSFLSIESLFYMMAWGFAFAGIVYHNFFYGFMLIEIIVRIDVMKNVIRAIYVPKTQILVTLVLFLMFIYYFTLFALTYFEYHFPNADDTSRMIDSILRMLEQTFKNDGGVGGYLDMTRDPNYKEGTIITYLGPRFWYDNIFNYLILVLIFQMFLSIIKDYFSREREDQQKFDETMQKVCLLCGIEREVLEKVYSSHKNAFDIHINQDHDVLDYICYLQYLQRKLKRDKIIEMNVWKLHLKNNYFFLPKNTCFKMREKNFKS